MQLSQNLLSSEDAAYAIEKHTYHRKSTMHDVHYHNHYEILYMLENEREIIVNQQRFKLNRDSIALIAPYTPHRTIAGEKTPETRILVNFTESFIHEISEKLNADVLSLFNPACPVVALGESEGEIREGLLRLLKIAEDKDARYNKERSALILSELLLCMFKLVGEQRGTRSFFDVTKYIETHFAENLTLDILAKRFFMSKFTFLRKFKQHTGTGLPAYLNTIRIINAKKMLSDGVRVSEAAMACGFESLSSFDRAFKKECKMTPREYKRSLS